jgi:hypothetical protein
MLSEDKLIGWACIFRNQGLHFDDEDHTTHVPDCVVDALVERGWVEVTRAEPDWNSSREVSFTEAGKAVTDLNAPEWGLEWVYEDSEA